MSIASTPSGRSASITALMTVGGAPCRGDRMRFGFGLASTREEVDAAVERMADVLPKL
jgi:hypothetical protein